MSTPQIYGVYLTTATSTQPVGTVVNNVLWDGSASWTPPTGQAAVADPDRQYPVNSTYTPPTS